MLENLKRRRFFIFVARYIFQLFILLLIKLLLQPFVHVQGKISSEQIKKNCILIANHRRAMDAFVVCGALPAKAILKLMPVGFITHNGLYDSPLRPLLWISGCYPARNPQGNHKHFGIEGGVELLNTGYSLCIFPEGMRVKLGDAVQARSGVIKIHKTTPSIPMVFAHIEYKGWRCIVTYKLVKEPHYNDAEVIMKEIFKL